MNASCNSVHLSELRTGPHPVFSLLIFRSMPRLACDLYHAFVVCDSIKVAIQNLVTSWDYVPLYFLFRMAAVFGKFSSNPPAK